MIGDALLTPEPFFCTLAIYDAFKRRKLSEDFHFDAGLSGDYKCVTQRSDATTDSFPLCRLLVVNDQNKVEEEIDPETQATKAIFVVTESHNQIFLVLRINHLMRAEIEKDSIYKAKAVRAACTSCAHCCRPAPSANTLARFACVCGRDAKLTRASADAPEGHREAPEGDARAPPAGESAAHRLRLGLLAALRRRRPSEARGARGDARAERAEGRAHR